MCFAHAPRAGVRLLAAVSRYPRRPEREKQHALQAVAQARRAKVCQFGAFARISQADMITDKVKSRQKTLLKIRTVSAPRSGALAFGHFADALLKRIQLYVLNFGFRSRTRDA